MIRTALYLTLPLTMALSACNGDDGNGDGGIDDTGSSMDHTSVLRGAVSDDPGTQARMTAGSGTVDAAVTVQAWTTGADLPEVIGQAIVASDASFDLEVLSETSVEAEVAAALYAHEQATGDVVEASLDALAEAMLTVQSAETIAAQSDNLSLSFEVLDDATAELYAEATGSGDIDAAYEAWIEAWAESREAQGADVEIRSELEAIAGLASRAVLVSRLSASDDTDAVIEAWMLSSGRREAAVLGAGAEAATEGVFDGVLDLPMLVDESLITEMLGLSAAFEASVADEVESTGSLATDAQLEATSQVLVMASGSYRGPYTSRW